MPEKLNILLITPIPIAPSEIETILSAHSMVIDSITSICDWSWSDEHMILPPSLAAALAEVDAGRIVLLDLCPEAHDIAGRYGLSIERIGDDLLYDFYLDLDLSPLPTGIPHTEAAWIESCLPHVHAVLEQYAPSYRAVAIGAELCLDYTGDLTAAIEQPYSNVAHWIINEKRGVG